MLKVRDAYVAIADPTRREILDLLRLRQAVPAGEIAAQFTHASRPAISKHLRVLRECGLVTTARTGKVNSYSLNAAPLNEMRDGWLRQFAGQQVESLVRLRSQVEED